MTNTISPCLLLVALASFRAAPSALAWTPPQPQPQTRSSSHTTGVRRSVATSTRLSLSFASSSNNVVLAPSRDDPAAFDSFAIGSPRVHRYTREGSDDDAEYVMWYEGRSGGLANDDALPSKMSTGSRIGRATSRNGLSWKKDRTGSESEDMKGVSLGLNKDSWWGFDTAHVGLGNVLLPMSTPAVMSDAGVFLMYYHGGSDETTPATDDVQTADSSPGEKVKGMKMRIGVALSQDGISFGRVEGDDPTGACIVPFDEADPNQKSDQMNAKLQEELYCAWPEVVLNQPIAGGDANFFMYYSTMTKADEVRCLAQAVSPDGFRWTKTGVCLVPDPEGSYDAGGCERCCVVRDAEYDPSTNSWRELPGWIMYYEGISAVDGKHRIMEARSKDGSAWTKSGLALAPREEADAWDCAGVRSPHVLR
jgi:hypothetical protein